MTRCSSSSGLMLSYVASTSSSLPSSSSTTPQSTLSQHVPGRAQLVAETWWALKTVSSNFSFSSNEDVGFVFGNMFPDSDIAKSMTCAETKSMYLACFGIAPHLQALLEKKVKGDDYVLLFDDSLNRELQKIDFFSKRGLYSGNRFLSVSVTLLSYKIYSFSFREKVQQPRYQVI